MTLVTMADAACDVPKVIFCNAGKFRVYNSLILHILPTRQAPSKGISVPTSANVGVTLAESVRVGAL